MSAHTHHPDVHLYGLADNCPRCDEHAAHPFQSLDTDCLRALVERVKYGLPPRSDNEAAALEIVRQATHRARLLLNQ